MSDIMYQCGAKYARIRVHYLDDTIHTYGGAVPAYLLCGAMSYEIMENDIHYVIPYCVVRVLAFEEMGA